MRCFSKAKVAFCILFALALPCAFGQTDTYRQRVERAINETIRMVHAEICDINGDGLVNCIDYAFSFYGCWYTTSLKYDLAVKNCQLIRNVNDANGFNHLFVRVRASSGDKWFYVEPAVSPGGDWDMKSAWGSRYNPMCNSKDETSSWVKTMSANVNVRRDGYRELNINGWN